MPFIPLNVQPAVSTPQQPLGIIFLLIPIKCNREKCVNPEFVKILKSISDAQWHYWCMFRCKDVSRMSWTGRWVTAALLNSPTEAVCLIWRPPLGKYCGFAPWHHYSSPMWLSVTPGTAMLTEFNCLSPSRTIHPFNKAMFTHSKGNCWLRQSIKMTQYCEKWPGCLLGHEAYCSVLTNRTDLEYSVCEWSPKNTFI